MQERERERERERDSRKTARGAFKTNDAARNLVSALTGPPAHTLLNLAPSGRGGGGGSRPQSPKNFRPINFKSNLRRARYVRIERTPNSALAKYWTYHVRTHARTYIGQCGRRSARICIAPPRNTAPPPTGCLPARRYYASLIGNGKRLPSLLQIFVGIRDRGRPVSKIALSLSLSLRDRSRWQSQLFQRNRDGTRGTRGRCAMRWPVSSAISSRSTECLRASRRFLPPAKRPAAERRRNCRFSIPPRVPPARAALDSRPDLRPKIQVSRDSPSRIPAKLPRRPVLPAPVLLPRGSPIPRGCAREREGTQLRRGV
jgi:hypothetical protein